MRAEGAKRGTAKVTFVNARTRFQRIDDAKLFNGWVKNLTAKGIIVSVQHGWDGDPGQKFRFEVFGTGAAAIFEARLEAASGPLAAFALTTGIRSMPSSEAMRLRTQDLLASLYYAPDLHPKSGISDLDTLRESVTATSVAEGEVVDISVSGLGLLSNSKFPKGERLRFVMETPWGKTEGYGEVRYCKPEGQRFRMGLNIDTMDRLNRSLFERLLQKSAAA